MLTFYDSQLKIKSFPNIHSDLAALELDYQEVSQGLIDEEEEYDDN